MKTLLVAVNSQYIHSCLAVWRLKAVCDEIHGDVQVMEYNINQQMEHVFFEICYNNPDIICFSCYIWNIDFILRLSRDIKIVKPNVKIILGGPEVSFDFENILKENEYIDIIMIGEGEENFPKLLSQISCDMPLSIQGIAFRENTEIKVVGEYQFVEDFASLKSPYTEDMLKQTFGKILYYESTRGCPFKCSYCLSHIGEGVRAIPTKRVKEDILFLKENNVPLLKFVDRTFNYNRARSVEIWNFISRLDTSMTFHFEVGGDLLCEEELKVLETLPSGRVQLEIGVQTTNPTVLSNVCRKTNMPALRNAVTRLIKSNNIHIHLDLIAGLPGEDLKSFKNSFNEVYSLKPHDLQLGFLKLIKGSKLRENAEYNECSYRNYVPYEVLKTKEMDYNELIFLKKIENVLNIFYNSGRFIKSLEFIILFFNSPFDFYDEISTFYAANDMIFKQSAAAKHYDTLAKFAYEKLSQDDFLCFINLLIFDYYSCGYTGKLPAMLGEYKEPFDKFIFEKLPENIWEIFKLEVPKNPKERNARYYIQTLNYNPLTLENKKSLVLFDTSSRNSITNTINSYIIDENRIGDCYEY